MSFISYLIRSFLLFFFNARAINSLAQEKSSIRYGLILLTILGVLWVAAFYVFDYALAQVSGFSSSPAKLLLLFFAAVLLFLMVYLLVGALYGLLHVAARVLGGKASFEALVRVMIPVVFLVSIIYAALLVTLHSFVFFAITVGILFTYLSFVHIQIFREIYSLNIFRASAIALPPLLLLFFLL